MKLLPLWSGIMVPFFGYVETISSTAAIKSSFNKLKNITFKHEALPTDLETFLETRVLYLCWASLLKSAERFPPHVVVHKVGAGDTGKQVFPL
jgi:hypothetical protein